MKLRYILIAVATIVVYNIFLIQRDEKLFKSYYKETAKQEYCKSLPQPHPDCTVE
jgi:hypothetical protein